MASSQIALSFTLAGQTSIQLDTSVNRSRVKLPGSSQKRVKRTEKKLKRKRAL